MTSARLQKKLAESIAAFTRTAKRSPNDLDQAVREWEDDLNYLKTTLYDRWREFPWPNMDV